MLCDTDVPSPETTPTERVGKPAASPVELEEQHHSAKTESPGAHVTTPQSSETEEGTPLAPAHLPGSTSSGEGGISQEGDCREGHVVSARGKRTGSPVCSKLHERRTRQHLNI